MKKIFLLLSLFSISALGFLRAQERLNRIPIGDQAIKEAFAKQIYRIRLSVSRTDDFVRVTNKIVMSSGSWSGHLSLIKNLAEEISANLDPDTEYVWWWGLFSHLQTGALIGMTSELDVIYFGGNKEEIQLSINRMIERIDRKIFEGYVPIYAPGVKGVRYILRDASSGDVSIDTISANGAYNCPSLLERAGDGWLWLPAVALRPFQPLDCRFYLYYSDDLSEWDEFDAGWGSKGDLIASSRGPVPPRLVISRMESIHGGSSGFLVRIAGLEPERQYVILKSSQIPFGENAQEYLLQADRLGVISVTLPRGENGGGFITLSTNPPSSSARRMISPATLP